MKKLLFLAAAIFATVSCSQVEDTDVLTPSLKKEITLTVSTDASASTRVSVTPDENNSVWNVQWSQGDCLAAWNGASSDMLSMVEFSDPTGKSATFGGSVTDGDIRLVYPYSDITGSAYEVDLSSQTCDMKSSFSQLGANVPMISPSTIAVADLAGDVAISHIGSALEIQLKFSDLVEGTTYILESVAIDAIPAVATIDLSADIDSDSFYTSTTKSGIEIDVTNSPELENDVIYSVNCAALPFSTSMINLTIELYAVDAEGNRSTLTIGDSLESIEPVEFGRSLHHTLAKACSIAGAAVDAIDGLQGAGTSASPYLLYTAADLYLATDLTVSGVSALHFTLMNDIDLGGSAENPWPMICPNANYKGIFEGNGYTVSGLYINNAVGYGQAGFIGKVGAGGIVRNLNVEGYVSVTTSNTGGIVGMNVSGTISNCTFTGDIYSTLGSVGGIIGQANGSSVYTDNCHFKGYISAQSGNVGGIAGANFAGAIVSNCSSSGTISGTSATGGIVGNHKNTTTTTGDVTITNYVYIYNCYNTSSVNCSGDNIGGIVGIITTGGTVANCFNVGDISGLGTVGGIVGNATVGETAVVDNCYNSGSISATNSVGGCVASGATNNADATKNILGSSLYYLDGCITSGTSNDAVSTPLDADAMAQLAATLNTAAAAYEGYELCGWVDGAESPMLVFGSDPASIVTTLSYWTDVASPNYGGGRGTEDSPYVISTPYELAHLAVEVAEGVDHSGVYFVLSSNIDLSGRVWTTVMDFQGELDYAGYSILNSVVWDFAWSATLG